jgi:hypothetical protein
MEDEAMSCTGVARAGGPCRMAPLKDSDLCWTHDPSKALERAEARQRGGRNRRTPGTVVASPGGGVVPAGLNDMAAIQAGMNLVWRDTLLQENSGNRSRTLVAVLLAAVKCLEVGEYEARIQALEQAVTRTGAQPWRGRAA